jgi:hypothetical protein
VTPQRSGSQLGDFVLTACTSEIDTACLDLIEDGPDRVGEPERTVHLRVHGAGNRLKILGLSSS